MSPTDSDRSAKSPAPKDKDDNPFIKFKRFADAQISAVLQGIIGLPSVFSKQPNDANFRWADINDDLKRRDKVLAEQRASKAAECSHSQVDSEDEEGNIPVKKFPGWSLPTSAQAHSPIGSELDDRNGKQDSIDLFSHVTKSLFAHLISNPADDVDWSKQELLAQTPSFEDTYLELQRHLRSDQKVGSALNMVQSMVFNNLNEMASFGNSQLLSSHSVLPYILFSPYSPLALSSMPPKSGGNSLFQDREDDFPYCAAFEDLLLASQGRPMAIRTLVPASIRDMRNAMISKDTVDREVWKAYSGLRWIERLWEFGLLTREPPSNYALVRPLEQPLIREILVKPGPDAQMLVEATTKVQGDQSTEQDAYDFLQRIGGSLSSPLPFRDAMEAMEAFIKDAISYLAEQENNSTGNKPLSPEQASPETAELDYNQVESGTLRRTGGKSTSTQTETFPEHVARAITTQSVESDQMDELQDGSAALPASDRVVTTTTTTRQTTDEDGSVHTTIMIQKVYADGRTSVTTTSKANFPSRHRNYTQEEWLGLSEDERCRYRDARYDEKDEPTFKKENKGRGWFWN